MKKLKELVLLLGLHSLILHVESDPIAFTQEISDHKLYDPLINPKILKLKDSIEINKKKQQKQREHARFVKAKMVSMLEKPNNTAISKCEKIKCAPINEPVCAKLSFKFGTDKMKKYFFHMIMVNECEMKYTTCRRGLHGTIVPMEFCERNIANYTKPVRRRSKREISGETQKNITLDLESAVLQNKITLPPLKTDKNLQNNSLNNTANPDKIIPKETIKPAKSTNLKTNAQNLNAGVKPNEKNINDAKKEIIKPDRTIKRVTNSKNNNRSDAKSDIIKPVKKENTQKTNARTQQNTTKKIPIVVNKITEVKHVYPNLKTPKLQDEDKPEINEIKTNDVTENEETSTAKTTPIGRTNEAVRSKGKQYLEKNVDQKPMFTHNVFSKDSGPEEKPPFIGSVGNDGQNIEGTIEIEDYELGENENVQAPKPIDGGGGIEGVIELDDKNLNVNPAKPEDYDANIEGAIEIDDEILNVSNIEGTIDENLNGNDTPRDNIQDAVDINNENLNSAVAKDDGPYIEGVIEIDDENLNDPNIEGTNDENLNGNAAPGDNIQYADDINNENLNSAVVKDDGPYIKGVIEIDDENLNSAVATDDGPYIKGVIEVDDENLSVPNIEGTIDENLNGNAAPGDNIQDAVDINNENLNSAKATDDGPNIEAVIEMDDENLNINPEINTPNEEPQLEGTVVVSDENINGEINMNADIAEPVEGNVGTNTDQDNPQIEGVIEISDDELIKNPSDDVDMPEFAQESKEPAIEGEIEMVDQGLETTGQKNLQGQSEEYLENVAPDKDYPNLLDIEEQDLNNDLIYNDPSAEDYQFEPPKSPSPIIETVVDPEENVGDLDKDLGDDKEPDIEGGDDEYYDDNNPNYAINDDEVKSDNENHDNVGYGGASGSRDEAKDNNNDDNDDLDKDVNKEQYKADCPTQCPSRDLMVCAKCQHGIHKTFLSVCHMRMFQCAHKEETVELVSREACVLSAPYITDTLQMEPKGRIQEPNDHDRVLQYIQCRASGKLDKDPKCAFDKKKSQRLNLEMMPKENETITEY